MFDTFGVINLDVNSNLASIFSSTLLTAASLARCSRYAIIIKTAPGAVLILCCGTNWMTGKQKLLQKMNEICRMLHDICKNRVKNVICCLEPTCCGTRLGSDVACSGIVICYNFAVNNFDHLSIWCNTLLSWRADVQCENFEQMLSEFQIL